MKLSAAMYDLKRGLIRPSIIITLLLFIGIGIGLTYVMSANLMTNSPGIIKPLLVFTYDIENAQLNISGAVYTPPSRKLSGFLEYELYCLNQSRPLDTDLPTYISSPETSESTKIARIDIAHDNFSFTEDINSSIKTRRVEIPDNYTCMIKYSIITSFGLTRSTTYLQPTIKPGLIYGVVAYAKPYGFIAGKELSSSFDLAIKSSSNTSLGAIIVDEIYKTGDKYIAIGLIYTPSLETRIYDLYVRVKAQPGFTPFALENPESSGFHRIATVAQGVFVAEFQIEDKDTSELINLDILTVGRDGDEEYYALITSTYYPQRVDVDPIQKAITTSLAGSISLFQFFFPVTMLYLAHVFIAKPRSLGALEFVLARPITRLDIYITRYIAGILFAIASSGLLFASLIISTGILLGVLLDPYVSFMLFAGTVLALIAFYSLCYFISSLTKGTMYLAFSIFMYLFFTIIVNIIQSILMITMSPHADHFKDFLILQFKLKYFNPLGVADFMTYFAGKKLGILPMYPDPLVDVITPWAVSISTTLWILVPFLLGWFVFKKANLSG